MHRKFAGGVLTLDTKVPESPHLLPKCIDIVTNNHRLSVAKYRKLKDHYEQCVHCQVLVGVFLRSAQREEQIASKSTTTAQKHLQHLVHMLHSIVREEMAVYIDVLEEQGSDEANERFPAFAQHLDSCQECRDSVEEIRKWLQET